MNPRVSELHEIIRAAEQELAVIKAECPHKTSTPGMYMSRPGAFEACLICDRCRAPVNGITEEQSKKVWDNFYAESKQAGSPL